MHHFTFPLPKKPLSTVTGICLWPFNVASLSRCNSLSFKILNFSLSNSSSDKFEATSLVIVDFGRLPWLLYKRL